MSFTERPCRKKRHRGAATKKRKGQVRFAGNQKSRDKGGKLVPVRFRERKDTSNIKGGH